GQKHWRDGRLHQAEVAFSRVLSRLEGEPRLEEVRAEARQELAELQARMAARKAEEQQQARFKQILALRDAAIFHGSDFSRLELPDIVARCRRAAREALALFDASGGGAKDPVATFRLGALPASLKGPEQERVKEGCCELLVILANAQLQAL